MSRPRPIPPPDGLDSEARALWRAAQRQLRDQGTWQDTDAALLESYVRAHQLARIARRAAEAEPFVEGSRSQLVAHPGLKIAGEAERDAAAHATKLLLTPEARRRHDVQVTEDGEPFLELVS